MAKKFSGETLHAVAARVRVNGSGALISTLLSKDEVRSQTLQNINMLGTTNIEPTILANFREQMMQMRIATTAINEHFNIGRIVIFIKPVAESYPIL